MTPDAARLYVAYLPGIVANLMAVVGTNPAPKVKAALMASLRTLQSLMLEANAVLEKEQLT